MIKCTLASIIGKEFCFDEWLDNLKAIDMPKSEMKLLWVIIPALDYNEIYERYVDYARDFIESEMLTSPFRFYDHLTEAGSPAGFLKKRSIPQRREVGKNRQQNEGYLGLAGY